MMQWNWKVIIWKNAITIHREPLILNPKDNHIKYQFLYISFFFLNITLKMSSLILVSFQVVFLSSKILKHFQYFIIFSSCR